MYVPRVILFICYVEFWNILKVFLKILLILTIVLLYFRVLSEKEKSPFVKQAERLRELHKQVRSI